MVDAMVALLIISMTIVLSLRAVQQAEQLAAMAEELRQANTLISDLMQDGPRRFQPSAGNAGDFAWTLQTELTGAERPIEVCRRVVTLLGSASGRRFQAASLEPCPPQASA